MSDSLSDTPVVVPTRCPGCLPVEEEYVVYYCDAHAPCRDGADDGLVGAALQGYLSGGADAGGQDNRAVCDAVHRPAERR